MLVTAWAIGSLLVLQGVILLWNIIYWARRGPADAGHEPTMSVLIPARDERDNLPSLLAALAEQSCPAAETIVCDDVSGDGTADWLASRAEVLGVRWFRGRPKPDGWAGKNWACHQLARHARADWLVFLDADVRPSPEFLECLGRALAPTQAGLVTALPTLRPSGVGDGLLVAMVPFSLFTTLPLICAERHPNPAFGFANGQVIAMRREDYQRLQPHESIRMTLLEDIELARFMKRQGERVLILDSRRELAVRMYQNTLQAIDGFSKNAVSICGGLGRTVAIGLLVVLLCASPPVLVGMGHWQGWPFMAGMALLFGVSSRLLGLPLWYGVLYLPAMLLTLVVLMRSAIWHMRGTVHWKGRSYPPPWKRS